MFQELYTNKFNAVMAREAGRISVTKYKASEKHYILHMMIPSEVVEKFYYDVVVDFSTQSDEVAAQPTLKNYDVKFFSNDPSFVFTYAYSFRHNKMFAEDFASKMSEMALKEKPKETNPKLLVGYVKSLYFAYLYYKLKGFDKKSTWYDAAKYNKTILLSAIMDADKKIDLRQSKGATALKKRAKEKKEVVQRAVSNPVKNTASITSTKKVGTVGHTSHVKRSTVIKKK
jgi:hypothetical protein